MVAVLVNQDADRPDAGALARRIGRVLLGVPPVPGHVSLSAAQRRALVGRYEMDSGGVREVVEEGGRLLVRSPEGRSVALDPLSPTQLEWAGTEGALVYEFEVGAEGWARGVEVLQRCTVSEVGSRVPGGSPAPD